MTPVLTRDPMGDDDDDLRRPMIVEIDKAQDRWWMWASGFIYGLLIGTGAGMILAAIWW